MAWETFGPLSTGGRRPGVEINEGMYLSVCSLGDGKKRLPKGAFRIKIGPVTLRQLGWIPGDRIAICIDAESNAGKLTRTRDHGFVLRTNLKKTDEDQLRAGGHIFVNRRALSDAVSSQFEAMSNGSGDGEVMSAKVGSDGLYFSLAVGENS